MWRNNVNPALSSASGEESNAIDTRERKARRYLTERPRERTFFHPWADRTDKFVYPGTGSFLKHTRCNLYPPIYPRKVTQEKRRNRWRSPPLPIFLRRICRASISEDSGKDAKRSLYIFARRSVTLSSLPSSNTLVTSRSFVVNNAHELISAEVIEKENNRSKKTWSAGRVGYWRN